MTPFRNSPEPWDGNEQDGRYRNQGGFKFDIISKSLVDRHEEMPRCFLAETPREAEEIYNRFEYLLNNFAYSYSISTGIEKADLFREALIGLARAYRDWDPNRSENFKSYAVFRIKDSLNEFVRDNSATISVPSYIKKANSNLKEIRLICERSNVNWQTIVIEQKIPQKLSMSDAVTAAKLVKNIINASKRAKVPYNKFVDRIFLLPKDVEFVDQQTNNDHERYQELMDAAIIVNKLKHYMDDDELLICEGVMSDKSYEQIGNEMNKSKAWVSGKFSALRERIVSMIESGAL